MAVVSASPQRFNYNSQDNYNDQFPKNWHYQDQHPTSSDYYSAPAAPVAPVRPAYSVPSVVPVRPAYSAPSVAPVRPAYSSPLVQPVSVAATSFDFNLERFLSFVQPFLPSAGQSLGKATGALDNLMIGLPAALKNMRDRAVKANFGKVNLIIAEECNKMVAEARPYAESYYTPEGIRVTCDFINKKANDIFLSLDEPTIIQYYTNKLKDATASLIGYQANTYQS